jgi:uncharacterized protein YjbJ (UPF0337 family)
MEAEMNRLQEKARGRTKQAVGQMIGDDQLVLEGKEQVRHAENEEASSEEAASEKAASEKPKSSSRKPPTKQTPAD